MMTNKEITRQYLEALHRDKSPKTLNQYIAEDELKQHIAMYEISLPGYWIEPQEMIAEGDLVNVRGTIHGVHSGPLMNIPPTGKKVEFSIFITYKFLNGKIVAHWMLVDMMTLMQQIGALPMPSVA